MNKDKRHAEALPHIRQYKGYMKCRTCGISRPDIMLQIEKDRLDFITAHRHKNITNLEKKEVNK